MLVARFARLDAEFCTEGPGEVSGIREATLLGDVCYRPVAVAQHPQAVLQAHAAVEPLQAFTGFLGETTLQLALRQVEASGNLVVTQWPCHVLFHDQQRSSHATIRYQPLLPHGWLWLRRVGRPCLVHDKDSQAFARPLLPEVPLDQQRRQVHGGASAGAGGQAG